MKNIVGCIFARGGSKGVPRKNIRTAGGKPLLGWAIEAARASKLIDRVIVSTDDEQIAGIARDFGAEVPFLRPAALANDDSPEIQAWQHAIVTLRAQEVPVEILASIPATSPLRVSADIDACIDALLSDAEKDLVITVAEASRNPYYNMVTRADDGTVRVVIDPPEQLHGRQAAPPVFDITTVAYAARADFVLGATDLFEGRVGSVIVPRERALDIDTEFDLRLADLLLKEASAS